MINKILTKNSEVMLAPSNISQERISELGQVLFLLTILFYPIISFSHVLYLIPQLMVMILAFIGRKTINFNDVFVFIVSIPAFTIPFIVEASSDSPDYDLAIKLFVNTATILLLIGNSKIYFTENALKWIIAIVVIWFFSATVLYFINGSVGISTLYMMLFSGSELNSSSLYGIAEPLGQLFLTKNISAMFVVSTFALYLYISDGLGKKVGTFIFLIFFTTSLSFLSRQAILAILVLYGFYRFMLSGYFSKLFVIAISFFAAFVFFLTFFDLTNNNDGASQRLELWRYFFENVNDFYILGMGLAKLNFTLMSTIGIDNFHMFFMNQIGAYGIFHFISFSIFLLLILFRPGWKRGRLLLALGYLLNVCFQTYGYEYGNLLLFMAVFIKPMKLNTLKHN